MDESLHCFKLSLLDVQALSLLQLSLAMISREEEEGSKELKPREKPMKITTTNNFSSLLHSVFSRRSGADIYRLREKLQEPFLLAQNPDLNNPGTAASARQGRGKTDSVGKQNSVVGWLRGCYPRGLLESSIGARISLDSDFKSWALF